ncbi:DNA gyrase inhibitor YacG [Sulfuriflexus sp.]|uniref:DNA gyrase inhibitor YacG n=1 Tax=Sulfuriflexus sp. TaxID=2015443 RepID=UPI0028CE45D4|nr:DNA gyrase inhibitor YacG [Sulfuriflexus sp.]MDT8404333.1 DNA gyrase inhibitor YacG [Sulfuriflexus sp.]
MTTFVKCPTCGKQVAWSEDSRWKPFCSERCKLIDLGAWADGSHSIPGEKVLQKSDSESED